MFLIKMYMLELICLGLYCRLQLNDEIDINLINYPCLPILNFFFFLINFILKYFNYCGYSVCDDTCALRCCKHILCQQIP